MRVVALLGLMAFPVVAHAQSGQPYKLLILRGTESIAVSDYPSAARCEAARVSIQRLMERENSGKEPRTLPGGGVFIPQRLTLESYCIPG